MRTTTATMMMTATMMGIGCPGSGWGKEPAVGVSRRAADLTAYPKLVVIYLGMRVYEWRGLLTVLRLRSEIHRALEHPPDGLLFHESFYFSLRPLHIGLRQYWRDFDSLERWTRSFPHQRWWKEFVRDGQGTGFWHETYLVERRVEGIYDGMREPVGLLKFAPSVSPTGRRLFARGRLGLDASESGNGGV
jgi:hypothetical protein